MNEMASAPEAAAVAMPPPPQVTLEFRLDPAAGRKLWRTRAVADLNAGRLRTVKSRITWHDTPDGGLAGGGHALLHVEQPGKRPWVLQRATRDGAMIWPLGTPGPVLGEAGDPAELPVVASRLTLPIATLEGHRRSLRPPADGPIAELVLLDGNLAAGADSTPIGVVSLSGGVEATFDLARSLLAELPLRMPAVSLSGEVRDRLHGVAPPRPPVLHEDLDVDDAFAHVVSQLASVIVHHAPGAREGLATEPVHQMRVALRRLRSALSLFRRVADSPELERAKRDLGGLARALGPARDWDVFLAGTGRDVGKLLPDEAAVARLNAAARRRRRAAYAELARVLDAPEFQFMLLDLVQLAVARPWQRDTTQDRPRLVAFARHALDRKLKRVLEAGDDLAPLPTEELHALRIRCKRLRYAAEFFAPLAAGKQSRRFLRRLAAVQERLGQLNDGSVAGDLLGELGSRGFAAGIVHGYLAAKTGGGRAKAERSWRKFRRTDPFWD